MTETPMAGWYTDPENPERLRYWDGKAWTGQIRASAKGGGDAAPRRRFSGIVIVGIVAATLLTIAGFAVIILNAGSEPTPTPSESPDYASLTTSETPASPTSPTSPDATRTAPAVLAPEGWDMYVSRSGAFEYAVNPDWIDTWTTEAEQMLLQDAALGEIQMEFAGSWLLDGSIVTGGTNLIIVATSDGTTVPGFMEIQAESFVRANAFSVESDDYEKILSEGFTTANGYDAWRIDYTMTAYEVPLNASVIAFRHETTLGFIYIASLYEFEEWLPDFLFLVDSFVVVKAPISP